MNGFFVLKNNAGIYSTKIKYARDIPAINKRFHWFNFTSCSIVNEERKAFSAVAVSKDLDNASADT